MKVTESAAESAVAKPRAEHRLQQLRIPERIARFREAALVFVLVVLFVAMTAANPAFLTYDNLITTVAGVALNVIIGVGMTFALVSGGFDLSVGSVFGAAGMVVAYLLTHGFGVVPAVVLAVLFGAGWGLVNGLLITRVGINPLIVTLGTLGMARGFAFIVSQGQVIGGLPQSFNNIGQSTISVFGRDIPSFVLIAFAIAIVGDVLLRRWVVLRQVYLIGGNEEAARLSGIRVNRVKLGVYLTIALLAGFAGVLGASRFASGSPTAGTGVELTVIAAVVIGGASLSGGEGTVLGAVLGLLLLGFVNDALILENVSVYWQQLISGAILVVAVTADRLLNRRRLGLDG
jgi:ribose transport system permease protein